jgi:hypothetical protein
VNFLSLLLLPGLKNTNQTRVRLAGLAMRSKTLYRIMSDHKEVHRGKKVGGKEEARIPVETPGR